MNNQIRLLYLLTVLLLTSCLEEIPQPVAPNITEYLSSQEQQLLKSSNEFSFELLRQLYRQDPGENLFYSPIGIGNGVGMALNVIEEKPKEELKNFLGIAGIEDIQINRAYYKFSELIGKIDRSVHFTGGNSFWINNQYTINQLIGDKLMAYYSAQVDLLNFESDNAVRTINKWASVTTAGNMRTVIGELNPRDRSYIINTMHIDLSGALHCDPVSLPGYRFILPDGSRQNSGLFRLETDSIGYYAGDQVTVVDLPLGTGKFHLIILMPDHPGMLGDLVEKVNPDLIEKYRRMNAKGKYELFVPELDLDKEVRLKKIFPQSGISVPIVTLRYYFDDQEIFISDFIQKSSISVGLQATDIQSIPAIQNSGSGYNSIIVDRPFLFLICEEFTGGILFTGLITHPGEE
ncbi:MAG TPA: serpin family protein [Cyclobacteriaceae bacterium]|nr:serpin family protein [Cyclobacteriaceae bacterium]